VGHVPPLNFQHFHLFCSLWSHTKSSSRLCVVACVSWNRNCNSVTVYCMYFIMFLCDMQNYFPVVLSSIPHTKCWRCHCIYMPALAGIVKQLSTVCVWQVLVQSTVWSIPFTLLVYPSSIMAARTSRNGMSVAVIVTFTISTCCFRRRWLLLIHCYASANIVWMDACFQAVCTSIHLSQMLLIQYLENCWMYLHQTFRFDAFWYEDKRFKFWGQKIKV